MRVDQRMNTFICSRAFIAYYIRNMYACACQSSLCTFNVEPRLDNLPQRGDGVHLRAVLSRVIADCSPL